MTNVRPRLTFTFFVAATAATIVGCASTAGPATPAGQPVSPTAAGGNAPARSTPSILIADDLRKSDAQNVGDAIQRLRPEWLRRSSARAANSMGTRGNAAEPLVVWIDNNRAGGVDILNQVQISNVRLVQYFTPSEAESRFGTGNSSGAIQIITMAAARP
jgi:hypothetical protein